MGQYYSRWHRFDSNGVKHIKRYGIEEIPTPLQEQGYTEWTRGTGPHSPEALQNLIIAVQRACKGVPKTSETKEKMRQAKLGKPKTEQHKLNMKLSHQRRRENNEERSSKDTCKRMGKEGLKCS
jgi:hypothetical protein